MSSRQEEKAARRAEREALEAATSKAASRSKLIKIVLGTILVLGVVAGSTVLVLSGGDKPKDGVEPPSPALVKAAAAAACVIRTPPHEGQTHVVGTVKYKSNPPTSGNHNQDPAQDGIYAPKDEPAKEHFVHSLEHGRVEIQYRHGTPTATIKQLEAVGKEKLNGSSAYHVLVFQNNTKMPYAAAAVAWDVYLGCKTMNPQVPNAIREFRKQYTDKGPELVP